MNGDKSKVKKNRNTKTLRHTSMQFNVGESASISHLTYGQWGVCSVTTTFAMNRRVYGLKVLRAPQSLNGPNTAKNIPTYYSLLGWSKIPVGHAGEFRGANKFWSTQIHCCRRKWQPKGKTQPTKQVHSSGSSASKALSTMIQEVVCWIIVLFPPGLLLFFWDHFL